MKVIAVVVTYNRLELLQRTVACLQGQTRPLDEILVVNNGSTDGTADWLAAQDGLHIITQGNTGGSGGFHSGIREAFIREADWIWCMDDDVFPRPDCLEQLLRHTDDVPNTGILAPRRLLEGRIFTNDFQALNLTNPFASMYRKKLKGQVVNAPTDICGTAFEGLCISKECVAEIGLPNRDLFIFCDDTDYCIRAVQARHRIRYIPDALMDKHRFFSQDTWTERQRKKKWKRFYQVRNATYLNHRYGRNRAVRHLRGLNTALGYMLIALLTAPFTQAYQWSDIRRFWRAYRDGVREKLGKYQ